MERFAYAVFRERRIREEDADVDGLTRVWRPEVAAHVIRLFAGLVTVWGDNCGFETVSVV